VAGAYGWNVKPQALLQLLSEGHREVVWIDSDIVATKDVRPAFAQLDSGVLVATEEALWTQNVTAQVW
jgi:lipopolysaccharide biosynthesis glycosyltransferase